MILGKKPPATKISHIIISELIVCNDRCRYSVSECAERYLYTSDTHKTYTCIEAAQNNSKTLCCITLSNLQLLTICEDIEFTKPSSVGQFEFPLPILKSSQRQQRYILIDIHFMFLQKQIIHTSKLFKCVIFPKLCVFMHCRPYRGYICGHLL